MADGVLLERETQLVPSDDGACIFNTDIILEILSWVPGKSLLRCRRVCKSWCSLISDPNFVRKQCSQAVRHSTNLRLLMFTNRFGNTEIWVMMEYGVEQSWTKLIVLKDQDLSHPVYVSEDDKVFIGLRQGDLKLYDLKANRYRSVLKPKKQLRLAFALYVETLVSPATGK
nr:uncharacterized protein LOC103443142 isoform X2 [Malus domestica]